nr:M20/M25/M40 family metallo-hydrolase [Candidatus Njordarchaeum guaymaensis]
MKLDKKSYVDHMFSFIERVCKEIGPRPGTSENEFKAGQMVRKEYDKFCDQTIVESFTCRPGGFLGILNIIPVLQILSTILYLFFPLVSLVLTVLAVLCYVLEMNHLREFVDPLFRKGTSTNVYGKIKAKGKAKATVIAGAHHDSPVEFPIPIKWRTRSSKFITVILVTVGLVLIVYAAKILGEYFNLGYMNWMLFGFRFFDLLVIVPAVGAVLTLVLRYGLKSGTQTLGANDNLSGVAVTLGVAEYFSKNRPKNVDVWLISHGCEECMRGSKRFVDKHWQELEKKNTYTINFDTAGVGKLVIVSEEKMYKTKHSLEICKMLQESASKCHIKYPVKIEPFSMGGTDSAFYSKKGLKATSVIGLAEDGFPVIWHNREDKSDKIDKNNLYDMLKLSVQFVEDLEQLTRKQKK